MFFRATIAFLVLAILWTGFEIVRMQSRHMAVIKAPYFQILAPENFKTTVVEFIDYNCPHCRSINPVVQEALRQRPDIRYIARPVAVVSAESENIVRFALAAGQAGKFWEVHNALLGINSGREVGELDLRNIAARAGLSYDSLMEDAKSQSITRALENNNAGAQAARLNSVPTFVIGNLVYVPRDDLPTTKELLQIIADTEK